MTDESPRHAPDPNPTPGLKRGERRRWVLVAGVVVFMLFLAVSLLSQLSTREKSDRTQRGLTQQVHANKTLGACQARFDRLTSQRSVIVSRYNSQKEDALSAVLDATTGTRAYVNAKAAYRIAQAALARELKMYPPPIYTCDEPPGQPTPTLTPSPLPTPPSTVTATQSTTATRTATATVPGPTMTTTRVQHIRTPGRTVTRTVVITRTVSPPSCLTNPIPPCVLDIRR